MADALDKISLTGHMQPGLDPETWKSYLEQASERQKQYVDQFNSQMDMLLLFVRLMRI